MNHVVKIRPEKGGIYAADGHGMRHGAIRAGSIPAGRTTNSNRKKQTDERSSWGAAECPGIGF